MFDVLRSIDDNSVDLILTSPPFLALRSYLPSDHPNKFKEIGQEGTPAAFIDTLMDLTQEWSRVLAPHGSIAVELGDTFSGVYRGQPDDEMSKKQQQFIQSRRRDRIAIPTRATGGNGWPKAKSLVMVPELYRIALSYGFNPLNPEHMMPAWIVRNVIRWHRPNPAPGSLSDKFRPSTTDMVVATNSAKRWFDLEAVRHPALKNTILTDDTAPPLDTWIIPTEGYSGAHYATFPRSLLEIPIKSMCPKEVCNVCGEPRRRITETLNTVGVGFSRSREPKSARALSSTDVPDASKRITTGWTDCGHNDYRVGVVLDPFVGSGTTLEVAAGLGRSGIGIDIDASNFELAVRRQLLGMFLEKETA